MFTQRLSVTQQDAWKVSPTHFTSSVRLPRPLRAASTAIARLEPSTWRPARSTFSGESCQPYRDCRRSCASP
jgi:hypothetical protein